MIGAAGVVVGIGGHVAVLLGGTLAWMGPVASWLTTQVFVCFGLLAVIGWLKRDWVWPDREAAARKHWWPAGWLAWSRWLVCVYVGYVLVQWVRGGGHISFVFGRGGGRGGGAPLADVAPRQHGFLDVRVRRHPPGLVLLPDRARR